MAKHAPDTLLVSVTSSVCEEPNSHYLIERPGLRVAR